MEEGLRQPRQDDLVVLQFDHRGEGAYSPEGLERPPLGDNVTLVCQLPHGKDWHEVSWLHRERVVFERGQPVPVEDGQEYSFSHLYNVLFFHIRNVSFLASGAVTCLDTVNNLPIKRYSLLPKVTRASQVFHTPMPNQLLTEGDTLTLTCQLRLPLSPEAVKNNFTLNHVMVRHKGRLLTLPAEAPYSVRPSSRPLPAENVEAYESAKFLNRAFVSPVSLTYFVPHLTVANDRGQAECWFRPHAGLHEWIVQTALITVQPRQS
ncbi:uncharacterized protein LOC129598830 isoform X2 [Paramacrobiotus metropolitanus]|nr:uncharacterized protein LOC129598830 isoform X2 [Paramacrobiotus metropolitanus]